MTERLPIRSDTDEDEDDSPDNAFAYIGYMMGAAFSEKMSTSLGGREIRIPRKKSALTPDHWLVEAMGYEDAAEIVELVGGEAFYVPHLFGPRSLSSQVVMMTEQGKTNVEIATELRISTRHVRRCRSKSGCKTPVRPTNVPLADWMNQRPDAVAARS